MPEYWVYGGAETQLQVGRDDWPQQGGEAFAGLPKGWVASEYVSSKWYVADFTKVGGLYTGGLDTCSALVYLFGPCGETRLTNGALWHVNTSYYEGVHAPDQALEAIRVENLELKFVVIGYNKSKQGVEFGDQVRDMITTFKAFLDRYKVKPIPWIYVGNSALFGVSREGYVGTPRGLIVDNVSSRRQSLSSTEPMLQPSDREPVQVRHCCSKCFITTAVCRARGLGDDCDELATLRHYRDTVLSRTEAGRADIHRYYDLAPAIVARIDSELDASLVYARIYTDEILPAIDAIRGGRHAQAHAIYRAMFERLRARYLDRPT
jgi:hypothetical protein